MDYPNLVWLGDGSYNFVQDILDELNLGLDPDVDMILPVTPMWSQLRAQYAEDYRDLERMDLYDRGLPTITHVYIFKVSSYNQTTYKPHDTGIFVQLVTGTIEYSLMDRDQFNIAKGRCRDLLITWGERYIDEVHLLDDRQEMQGTAGGNTTGQNIRQQVKLVKRVAHEFLGILHHYQIHFKNRSGPNG